MSGKADSASAIHSGSSATTKAAMPEGTVLSARKVKYCPPTISRIPTMADVRRSLGDMRRLAPRHAAIANISAAAGTWRTPANSVGGSPESSPILIARYVVPHTTYMIAMARMTLARRDESTKTTS